MTFHNDKVSIHQGNKIIGKIVLVKIETHTFIKLEIKGNTQPDKGHPCKLGS